MIRRFVRLRNCANCRCSLYNPGQCTLTMGRREPLNNNPDVSRITFANAMRELAYNSCALHTRLLRYTFVRFRHCDRSNHYVFPLYLKESRWPNHASSMRQRRAQNLDRFQHDICFTFTLLEYTRIVAHRKNKTNENEARNCARAQDSNFRAVVRDCDGASGLLTLAVRSRFYANLGMFPSQVAVWGKRWKISPLCCRLSWQGWSRAFPHLFTWCLRSFIAV